MKISYLFLKEENTEETIQSLTELDPPKENEYFIDWFHRVAHILPYQERDQIEKSNKGMTWDGNKWVKFEKGKRKKLLFLIHPESILENAPEKYIKQYLNELNGAIDKFDRVVVFSYMGWIEEYTYGGYKEKMGVEFEETDRSSLARKYANEFNKIFSHNNVSYTRKQDDWELILDFVKENPNTTIYVGGGYDTMCVRDWSRWFNEKIYKYIGRLNIKFNIYPKLIVPCDVDSIEKPHYLVSDKDFNRGDYVTGDDLFIIHHIGNAHIANIRPIFKNLKHNENPNLKLDLPSHFSENYVSGSLYATRNIKSGEQLSIDKKHIINILRKAGYKIKGL